MGAIKAIGVHLAVAIHFNEDIAICLERFKESQFHRAAHTQICWCGIKIDLWILERLNNSRYFILTAIIHDDNVIQPGRQSANDLGKYMRVLYAGMMMQMRLFSNTVVVLCVGCFSLVGLIIPKTAE